MVLQHLINFWKKYENLNLKIAFILVALQIIHLYWISTDVVAKRITGESLFLFPQEFLMIFIIIDYLEIPALIAGVTFYSFLLYTGRNIKNAFLLAFLAVQFFHLFWLTDEIVYETFFGASFIGLPAAVAWVAIAIDYLEIPVIADLFRRLYRKRFR